MHQVTPVASTATAAVTAAGTSNEVENSTADNIPDLSAVSQKKRKGTRRVVPTESVSAFSKTASRPDLRRRREAFVAADVLASKNATGNKTEDNVKKNNSSNNAGLADESSPSAQTHPAPRASGTTASASAPPVESRALSEAAPPLDPDFSAPAPNSTQEASVQKEQEMATVSPEAPSAAAKALAASSSDLPGSMQLDDLLELLQCGARPAYNALIDITTEIANNPVRGSRNRRADRHAGPDTPAGICRKWWDAAWEAGQPEAASVAADVLTLHLGAKQVL